MNLNSPNIAIIGAGPCGLGAAWRLHELGCDSFDVFEKNTHVGGLSASFVDAKGFTWDIGGHVMFSHYDYYDKVMQTVIPQDGWLSHERESWIWMHDRFIPYPLQYNIGWLPQKEMLQCLAGLIACKAERADTQNHNFLEWIQHSFGDGLAKHFLVPYNKKVWAYPPEQLNATWVGERVAVPNVDRILENIVSGRDDCSWGPNNTFSFPLHGATGSVWNAVAGQLPQQKIHLGAELVSWDSRKKVLKFSDGMEKPYDYLISTIPIDQLLATGKLGPAEDETFVWSTTNVVGIGLKGAPPEKLRTKCWMYFPEEDNPFYRVTVFSNYSHNNVPPGGYWSVMGEVAESPQKAVDPEHLIDSAIKGFNNTGLIEDNDAIVSTWTHRAAYGYPTPFLDRDKLLKRYLTELQEKNVYSRGRFGAWIYECGNMDHVFMQGVEAVEHILFGTPEITINYPSFINSNRIR
jgi:protoporphyrinogen oxidase